MASQSLPPIASLETAPDSEITDIVDYLFEPSPELHKILLESLRTRSFSSYSQLIDSVDSQLTQWSESEEPAIIARLEEILGAHPRLGEKKVDSAQSRAEQAQLRAGDGSQESELMLLNMEYEKTFPGLRYVVFVNGRSRTVIMQDMRARIERGNIKLERRGAIQAMCDIAKDRATKAGVIAS